MIGLRTAFVGMGDAWIRSLAATSSLALVGVVVGLTIWWDDLVPKRVAVIVPGKIYRGAWQRPGPLDRLIQRESIRAVVTLTAINRDDPKYVDQRPVVEARGVRWLIVPMRGSRGTMEQFAVAADLLADPDNQPVFLHCVAGHHRSSQVQAAYRIRHQGWSASAAWDEVARLSWATPEAPADQRDRMLIDEFAAWNQQHPPGTPIPLPRSDQVEVAHP